MLITTNLKNCQIRQVLKNFTIGVGTIASKLGS
jgi:hypothetical protein